MRRPQPISSYRVTKGRVMKTIFPLLLVFALLVLAEGSARGQQPPELPRIGVLSQGAASTPRRQRDREAFEQELQKLGYVEGKTIVIEYQYGRRPDLLSELAADLVRLKVSLVVTSTAPVAKIAMNATKTIPIVMVNGGGNPVDRGLVESLRRPGGNVTGLYGRVKGLYGKRMELLIETFPSVSRVAVLFRRSRRRPRSGKAKIREFRKVAKALGVDIRPVLIRRPNELQKGFSNIRAVPPDALITLLPGLTRYAKQIAAFAIENRLPSMYESRLFVKQGGLMSFGLDWPATWRRAAGYVDKILKGADPATLPVEPPPRVELVINLKTARKIGVTIPPGVLMRADEVIK